MRRTWRGLLAPVLSLERASKGYPKGPRRLKTEQLDQIEKMCQEHEHEVEDQGKKIMMLLVWLGETL